MSQAIVLLLVFVYALGVVGISDNGSWLDNGSLFFVLSLSLVEILTQDLRWGRARIPVCFKVFPSAEDCFEEQVTDDRRVCATKVRVCQRSLQEDSAGLTLTGLCNYECIPVFPALHLDWTW